MTTCCDCSTSFEPTPARPTRCARCHQRYISRENRRWRYHNLIKKDPELLAQHREQCRRSMVAVNARRSAARKAAKGGG